MDFLKILRSLEEFLYEALSWLVFYPRTLWRTVRDPLAVARQTERELLEPPGAQFDDMVSPMLTLILSILLAHGIEMATRLTLAIPDDSVLGVLFGSQQGLLAARSFAFGLYALLAAVWILVRQHARIDRNTLRLPVFIESYLVSPFAIAVSIGNVMLRAGDGAWDIAGGALCVLAIAWYLWAQARVYAAMLGIGWLAAGGYALASFALTTVLMFAALAVMV